MSYLNIQILGYKNIEILEYWDIVILSYWNIEKFKYLNIWIEIFEYWYIGRLRYWNIDIMIYGYLKQYLSKITSCLLYGKQWMLSSLNFWMKIHSDWLSKNAKIYFWDTPRLNKNYFSLKVWPFWINIHWKSRWTAMNHFDLILHWKCANEIPGLGYIVTR